MFTGEDTRAFACACVRKRAIKASQSDILFPKQQSQKVWVVFSDIIRVVLAV